MTLLTKSIASSFIIGCAVGFTIFFVNFTKPRSPSAEQDHLSLSAADLSKIMIAVTAVENSPLNVCQFSQDQLMMFGQSIRPLLSERYSQDLGRLTRAQNFPKDCATDCTCSFYIGFFEEAEAEQVPLNEDVKALWQSYTNQLEAQEKNVSACMENAGWICKSPVILKWVQ